MSAAARWLRARWRQSILVSFTVTGIAAIAVLAFVVSEVVGKQIRSDAMGRARATTQILARSAFAPQLPANGGPLSRHSIRTLDAQVTAARASVPGTEVVLRGPDGRVVYSSEHARATTELPIVGTHVVGSGGERRVRSTLPVRVNGSRTPRAYLQLEAPYAPIAADIRSRTERLDVTLALAGLAIYLLALPGLLRAARAVKMQYDPRRVELMHDIHRAIKHHEISLAYQPIIDARTGELRSVEALVRWTDPRRGPIPPGVFIPEIEQTTGMWELSSHIFDLALEQSARWKEEGRDIRVAVNVSGAVLLDDRLIGEIEQLADKHGVEPSMLELEITEGAVVQDPREATRVLKQIGQVGLRVIAIDDFGTGYSSLARLHELPLDTLKIDQSFVMRMAADGESAVVRSVVELAHALSLDVIAEGVEDAEIAARLCELGVEYLQGYHLSRPIPAAELTAWVDERAAVAT